MSVKEVLLGWGLVRFKRSREAQHARKTAEAAATTTKSAQAATSASADAGPAARAEPWWRAAGRLLKDAAHEWSEDKAPRLGAALSYYTVFALAPVLLVAISVAGLVFGEQAAQGQILGELEGMMGPETANLVQQMLTKSAERGAGIVGMVAGLAALLLGATAVMLELEAALNTAWKVKPRSGRGIKGLVKDRILSLGLVLSLGFLLLVSLVASAALTALGGALEQFSFPGAGIISQVVQNLVSLGVITAFFALAFKYLADAEIAWRDVWVGALVTSLLFNVGKVAVGMYLGRASVGSTFGAAGSLAILLVWIYYTAQIVLFGAEITRLYAERYGSGIRPDKDAVPARAQTTA